MDEPITLLGIRHHGPGCAHALLQTLEQLQPDIILLEGAEELQDSWPLMAEAGMRPPLAQLVFDPKAPHNSVIYPWAEFSPEWQAMQFALQQQIPLQMIDLPAGISAARRAESEAAKAAAETQTDNKSPDPEPAEDEPSDLDIDQAEKYSPLPHSASILNEILAAAGFSDHEQWWDSAIERHAAGPELFSAVADLMTLAREQYEQALTDHGPLSADDARRLEHEQQREAWMRRRIRAAAKEHNKVAVICGAWHVPALKAKVTLKADNARLKGLKKLKMDVSWVPYTFQRLSQESGYGAGVTAPAWYQHLFDHHQQASSAEDTAIQWLIRTARTLRDHGFDCSSAHVIEAVRLAISLAGLRGHHAPSLTELLDATRSVMTEGRQGPVDQIYQPLVIGEQMGALAASVPTLPIEQDLDAAIKRLRLKKTTSVSQVSLDLRKENGLARSQLFRRLLVLEIPWAVEERYHSGQGSFREEWQLQWQPEFAIPLLDASLLGHTLEQAAGRKLKQRLQQSHQVAEIVADIDRLLLCHLPDVLPDAVQHLQNVAAVSADLQDMMDALLPLIQLRRYGSVRQLDSQSLDQIADSIIIRSCNGIVAACSGLDEDTSYRMLDTLESVHNAINLTGDAEHLQRWQQALLLLGEHTGLHAVLSGRINRLLHEIGMIDSDALSQRFQLNVSACQDVETAAAWVEGLLLNAAGTLLFDDTLFSLLDRWLTELEEEEFVRTLPLIRRAFCSFRSDELHQLGLKVTAEKQADTTLTGHWSPELADMALDTLGHLLGLLPPSAQTADQPQAITAEESA